MIFFRLRLQSNQYDLQQDFALVADDADRSVIMALLQTAFLEECDHQGLGPRVGHSPVCQILLQIVVRAVLRPLRQFLLKDSTQAITYNNLHCKQQRYQTNRTIENLRFNHVAVLQSNPGSQSQPNDSSAGTTRRC